VEAAADVRAGQDDATSGDAGTMPTASWRAFVRSVEIADDSPLDPGKRVVCSGGGRNAKRGTAAMLSRSSGCPPGHLRRATGNRVDVRQLETPLLPLADQERYALAFRSMRSLESITSNLRDRAAFMAGSLTAGLASGDFRPGRETAPS
jgi:hypothetical protein